MKRSTVFAAAAVLLLSGCTASTSDAEIKIPILGGNAGGSFTTAAAERYDVEEYKTIGASVEYVYAEALNTPFSANLLEYNVRKGDRLSEGDVIAVFDSSALNYDEQNQKILTDSAYSRYLSTGSELARLEYEQEAAKLELIHYKIDQFTIRAPYDCIITDTASMKTGDLIEEGTMVCCTAKPDEVYITVKENKELFSFGMPVTVTFGTAGKFSAKVAMMPRSGKNEINKVLIRLDDGELERANEEAGNIATAGWGSVIVTDYRDYNVLCIPEKAVMSYSGESYCYIEENGERLRVPVEPGRTVNGLTVILSGLSDGDIVSF